MRTSALGPRLCKNAQPARFQGSVCHYRHCKNAVAAVLEDRVQQRQHMASVFTQPGPKAEVPKAQCTRAVAFMARTVLLGALSRPDLRRAWCRPSGAALPRSVRRAGRRLAGFARPSMRTWETETALFPRRWGSGLAAAGGVSGWSWRYGKTAEQSCLTSPGRRSSDCLNDHCFQIATSGKMIPGPVRALPMAAWGQTMPSV